MLETLFGGGSVHFAFSRKIFGVLGCKEVEIVTYGEVIKGDIKKILSKTTDKRHETSNEVLTITMFFNPIASAIS